jgi:hypothetical protein
MSLLIKSMFFLLYTPVIISSIINMIPKINTKKIYFFSDQCNCVICNNNREKNVPPLH